MDRGIDLGPFADAIAESKVRTVVCMPDTGVSIRDRLRAKAAPGVLWADDMETAVKCLRIHRRRYLSVVSDRQQLQSIQKL
jgi:hypothetical protein